MSQFSYLGCCAQLSLDIFVECFYIRSFKRGWHRRYVHCLSVSLDISKKKVRMYFSLYAHTYISVVIDGKNKESFFFLYVHTKYFV
jgi:hypothetical protein